MKEFYVVRWARCSATFLVIFKGRYSECMELIDQLDIETYMILGERYQSPLAQFIVAR